MSMSADELNRTGASLWLKGDAEGARHHYLAALSLDPDFFPALANMAVVEGNLNHLASAEAYVTRSLNFSSQDGMQWNNLGNILTRLKRYSEASRAIDQAVTLSPDNAGTWHNLSLLSHRLGDYSLAVEYIQRVRDLGNNSGTIQNDLAHMLLAQGTDLHSALEVYEARWTQLTHLASWDFHIPEWKGEDLRGKKILLHGEQGHGDTIMCARFARELMARGAWVTLGVPKSLTRLFDAQPWLDFSSLAIEDMNSENMSQFDFQTPMFSALYHLDLGWSDISAWKYITPPDYSVPRVTSNTFNVGICWVSGKSGNRSDWRHAPLEFWLPLSSIPNVRLYSLYKGPDSKEIYDLGAEGLVHDDTTKLDDWADTAAYVSQLDLIICVDTAIAHLAGAMDIPVWLLHQFSPCWRWQDLSHSTGLPWYNSVRSFRQEKPGDWESLLRMIRIILQNKLKTAS